MYVSSSYFVCKGIEIFSCFFCQYQNVPPAVLVRFLREHRSEWADFNVDAYSAASLKSGSYAYPGLRPTRFTGGQIIMPLGHTIEHEEVCFFNNNSKFYFILCTR